VIKDTFSSIDFTVVSRRVKKSIMRLRKCKMIRNRELFAEYELIPRVCRELTYHLLL
jgi:hypothetical protein